MIVKQTGGSDYENPDAGSYPGICYSLLDLGTQKGEYQGKDNTVRKVVIGFEIDEHDSGGKPFTVSKFYTQSLHEKSNLRKDLESWRGTPFTEQELEGFDLKKLLGKSALIGLTKKQGEDRVKVTTVAKLPKSMAAPQLSRKHVYLSLDPAEFDPKVFATLGDGIKKIILQSPEYHALGNKGADSQESEHRPGDDAEVW